jgi:hypothetical protein
MSQSPTPSPTEEHEDPPRGECPECGAECEPDTLCPPCLRWWRKVDEEADEMMERE